MKSYFILIQLEVKRALKRLGYLYLGMAALLILAGAAPPFLQAVWHMGTRCLKELLLALFFRKMTDWPGKPCPWLHLWKVWGVSATL